MDTSLEHVTTHHGWKILRIVPKPVAKPVENKNFCLSRKKRPKTPITSTRRPNQMDES